MSAAGSSNFPTRYGLPDVAIAFKYVNMTDVTSNKARARAADLRAERKDRRELAAAERAKLVACMELLFFAYRDFTGDPDAVLARYGFGRAHHRVLHFVNRNPGLRVADVLDILRITKQSLARVLKALIDDGFIMQKAGKSDRRERLLFATGKGARLAEKLADLQIERISAAFKVIGPEASEASRRFLFEMIAEDDRARVEALIKDGSTDQTHSTAGSEPA